jgi:hypothetical protein
MGCVEGGLTGEGGSSLLSWEGMWMAREYILGTVISGRV